MDGELDGEYIENCLDNKKYIIGKIIDYEKATCEIC